MNWLILVAVAVLTDSLRIYVDNYSSDVYFKGRYAVSQKLFYGIISLIAGITIAIILSPNLINYDFGVIALLLFSGFLSSVASIPYYRALEIEESTNIGIFTQLAPVLYLIIGWFLFGDSISLIQLVAFFVILSAPLIIVMSARKRSRKIKTKAALLAFLYVIISVIGNIIFVKTGTNDLDFITKLAPFFIGKGIAGIVIVCCIPKWRRRFFTVMKKSQKKVLQPLFANSIIGLIKDFSYRGALATAPAIALASVASDAIEPIVIFFLGLLLTLIWPKFGREKLNKKTVFIHFVATILVVIGILLLQL